MGYIFLLLAVLIYYMLVLPHIWLNFYDIWLNFYNDMVLNLELLMSSTISVFFFITLLAIALWAMFNDASFMNKELILNKELMLKMSKLGKSFIYLLIIAIVIWIGKILLGGLSYGLNFKM